VAWLRLKDITVIIIACNLLLILYQGVNPALTSPETTKYFTQQGQKEISIQRLLF